MRAKVTRTTVRAGARITVTAKVKAAGQVKVTGRAKVLVDGRTVRTVKVVRGKVATSIVVARGKHRVVVRYLGSTSVAKASSPKQVVRGT